MKKRSLLLSVFAAFGFTIASWAQVPTYVPTNGLVGWWPFNGNANDESGNGNNGTVNGATLTTDRFGNANSAYSFNGNQYIDITNTNGLNSTNSISMSIWFNWAGPNSWSHQYFYQISPNPNGAITINNDGTLGVNVLNCNCQSDIGISTMVSQNTWYNVFLTYDLNQGLMKMYLNGVLIGTTQESIFSYYTTNNPGDRFGCYHFNEYFFNGKLDAAGLWNRELTNCEIVALYNEQISTQPTTACYETASFNTTTCQWDVSGTQPTQPTTACYETATFNTTTCQWDVTGTQPTQPTTACYETATFNTTTCQWDVTGTQPTQPTTACYETASFNTTTCQWDVTGTQPTTACYETATFNTTTCQWDVTGSPASISQPTNQTINVNNNAQFVVGSSDPTSTFQWQTDLGVGFQNLNSVGQYSGTTNDTLTVSNVTISNNNQPYRCIVSSGSCSDTSNVAVLTVSNNVGINETSQDKLFSVFPNPAQSIINVKADSKLIGTVYSIYDNTGRVVLTGKLNSENTIIELGNLSGGIYMFSAGENMKQVFKVIKE
jgi:hypothetical protein